MALYAIGDVHGCAPQLHALLEAMAFNPRRDRLWFVGDLINRGPDSLGVLRLVRDLGDRAISLMGNHELRAVSAFSGSPGAVFQQHMRYLAEADEADEWAVWLRRRPFIHWDDDLGIGMVHAGLLPSWSLRDALAYAEDLHQLLADPLQTKALFDRYRKKPPLSLPAATAPKAAHHYFRMLVFTTLRLCTRQGELLTAANANAAGLATPYDIPPADSPYQPWFDHYPWQHQSDRMVYGHWAAAGFRWHSHVVGLDSGCIYGGKLTAIRLDRWQHGEPPEVFQVNCPTYIAVGE